MPNNGKRKGMGKGGGRGGKHGGSKSGGTADISCMKEKMYDKLNAKLLYTAYCREGYTKLDSFFEKCDTDAQASMNVGAATFHHMMYAQVEPHFQKSIKEKPDCAMTYGAMQ